MTDLHSAPDDAQAPLEQDSGAPACVLCFNASEPTGASGLGADISTVAAMGAHALPICTSVVVRDTAEVFESQALDADLVVEQARAVLEDISPSAWKLGFLGSADVISAVAEIVSDYADIPLVAHLPNLSWLGDDEQMAYLDAFRELILPGTLVLSGNHKTLTDFLLPEWDAERQPSARELAVAAAEHGASYVFVTGIRLPDQFIDNVLASPEGAIAGERFERFEAAFVGAGDTLSAALAATLSSGTPLDAAMRARGGHEAFGFNHRGGDRLFHEHIDAGGQQPAEEAPFELVIGQRHQRGDQRLRLVEALLLVQDLG